MYFSRNEHGVNSESSESPNPMKMIKTPQIPTQEQRDSGGNIHIKGEMPYGKNNK